LTICPERRVVVSYAMKLHLDGYQISMQRIPTARDVTPDELILLREIVARSFIPGNQIDPSRKARLLELELVQFALGGLMPTPAGRIVARL
jgi:hypothetical protein